MSADANDNPRVNKRAGVVAEAACLSCPCFVAYAVGCPGARRGYVGECTFGRAEEPPNATELVFTDQIPCFLPQERSS